MSFPFVSSSIVEVTESESHHRTAIAGETLTAGLFVYLDTDGNAKIASPGLSVENSHEVVGMTLNDAFEGQPVTYTHRGTYGVQDACFPERGRPLVLAAGGSCQLEDDLDDEYLVLLGWTTETNQFELLIHNTDVFKGGF